MKLHLKLTHRSRLLRPSCAALALVALALPARLPSAQAAPITITYLNQEQPIPLIQSTVNTFNQTHPNIHVVLQNLPFDQLFPQIEVRLGSGSSSPDVIDVDAPVTAAYAVQGFLTPLDSYFSKADLAQFVPASLSTSYYLGHLLAPPINGSSQLLYYNKDLLKKAGVPFPPNDVSKRLTWEQLVTNAKKAQVQAGKNVTAWGFVIDQIDRPYQLLPLPESLGGQPISKDGLHASGIVNSPAWIKAFTWYSNLFNTWKISPIGATPAQTPNLFSSGHAAYFWGGPWNVGTFQAAKGLHWGVAPTPYFAGGKAVTPNDSWHLGVNRHSAHIAAAAEFVRWLTVGPGNDIFVKGNGQVPSLLREITRINQDSAYATFPSNVLRLTSYEAQHTAIPRPVTPGFNEYQDILTRAFDNIRSGQSSKAALDAAAAQIDRAMAKYARAPH